MISRQNGSPRPQALDLSYHIIGRSPTRLAAERPLLVKFSKKKNVYVAGGVRLGYYAAFRVRLCKWLQQEGRQAAGLQATAIRHKRPYRMADGWDDWGDDDDNATSNSSNKSATIVSGSEKSEGWDWPSTAASTAEVAFTNQRGEQNEESSAALEQDLEAREAAVEEMTETYFVELRKYREDLADPSVREGINQVCAVGCLGVWV